MPTDHYLFGPPRSVKSMRLQVSANGRYLADQHGRPFFYLGDTAWTLFKRLSHDELERYLHNRAAKGFNAIQAYVLRGIDVPNLYGQLPLIDGDPTTPNDAFFQNVDYVIDRANELGFVIGAVATFGQHVSEGHLHLQEVIFHVENARVFGQFLGRRYRDNCVIWYLGGDRAPTETQEIWAAMGLGLQEGSEGRHLVSYHGPGSLETPSSSYWLHEAPWLDFNTIQSGHGWTVNCYDYVSHDYQLTPIKPTIDMEAGYENHPDFRLKTGKRIDAHQVREFIYWDVLASAAGHGYGCQEIWSFYDEAITPFLKEYSFGPMVNWRFNTHWHYAMNLPGAYSVGLARKLFELRPWYRLVPDQSVIAEGQGEGEDHIQAAIAADGSFLLAYLPFGQPVAIHMERITGTEVRAFWYNPRDGRFIDIARYPNHGIVTFTPPTDFDRTDWVLVLDDAGRNYPVSL